jgi:bacterioferritin-associated ferredoxin
MHVLSRTRTSEDSTETIICHCLQISESTIVDAVGVCGMSSFKEVCHETGAGTGCTACHLRLKAMIRKARRSAPTC